MHQDLKDEVVCRFDTKKLLTDYKVATAAHREKFSKSLDETEYYCFKPFHCL